jgi:hypothetical protein
MKIIGEFDNKLMMVWSCCAQLQPHTTKFNMYSLSIFNFKKSIYNNKNESKEKNYIQAQNLKLTFTPLTT